MSEPESRSLPLESAVVQSHLTNLQGIIGRLASNSASCKTWCVTLTSALAVVVADSGNGQLLVIAAMPIGLFTLLDAYYLGLERRFRACYETFVRKLHEGTAKVDDAFLVAPKLKVRGLFKEAGLALFSFSVWPFYVGLATILWMMSDRLTQAAP